MAQMTELINSLKQVLKTNGKTCVDVVNTIKSTAASITRTFSKFASTSSTARILRSKMQCQILLTVVMR
jgi:hypothetical protein